MTISPKKQIDLKTMTILIVDDAKNMRAILKKMLKNLQIGGKLYMAENGVEALKVLGSNPVDIAIVDWRMPVMNGPELLEAIRKDRKLRDMPILMVTAESERDIVMEVAEIEVDGYLLKPLTPALLEEKITGIVHQTNHPDKATIHIKTARAFSERKEYKIAIRHMKQAVALRPKASRVLRNLGLLYQKIGAENNTLKCLKKAASINPQDVVTRQILADIYWDKKDYSTATTYYGQVISMTRKFTDKALMFGEELLQNKLNQAAIRIFSNIILNATKNNEIKKQIVEICMENKEWGYSRKLLKELIKDYPSDYDWVYKMGLACEKLDDFDAALKYYLTIEKFQSFRIDVLVSIAKIYYDKQKIYQADEYLNKVLRVEPRHKEALLLRQMF